MSDPDGYQFGGQDENFAGLGHGHRTHYIKSWAPEFQAVLSGAKTFEARYNDRGYAVGDDLILEEYNPVIGEYTGRTVLVHVTRLLKLDDLPNGPKRWVVMGIRVGP